MTTVGKSRVEEFDKIAKLCCRTENAYKLSRIEKNGYFGVMIVLAYLDGVIPTLKNMAHYLNLNPFLIEDAFKNLRVNGVFSASFNLINDPIFKGQQVSVTEWADREHQTELAWCHIAGLASGLIGLK